MHTVQTRDLELMPAHHRDDSANVVRIVVGDQRRRAGAGTLTVVPAEVPHDVIGAGDAPARVTGVFGSNTIVSVFDDEWVPYGTRVLGTPPPAELSA